MTSRMIYAALVLAVLLSSPALTRPGRLSAPRSLAVLASVVAVEEAETGMSFEARVDTGARLCSIDVRESWIEEEGANKVENVGKLIHFRTVNRAGDEHWLVRRIEAVDLIRTSEMAEARYLVTLRLTVDGLSKDVLVSLNNRSEMTYAMLLGRNLLAGDFLVDVSQGPADRSIAPSSELVASTVR